MNPNSIYYMATMGCYTIPYRVIAVTALGRVGVLEMESGGIVRVEAFQKPTKKMEGLLRHFSTSADNNQIGYFVQVYSFVDMQRAIRQALSVIEVNEQAQAHVVPKYRRDRTKIEGVLINPNAWKWARQLVLQTAAPNPRG